MIIYSKDVGSRGAMIGEKQDIFHGTTTPEAGFFRVSDLPILDGVPYVAECEGSAYQPDAE